MRKIFLAAWLVSSELALGGTLTVAREGMKKTYELEALGKPVDVSVLEPHEQKALTFKALPLDVVLDKTYGPEWRKQEELLFTCADGYQPSIPVALLRDHKAYLAVGMKSGPFSITNHLQNDEKVDLSPAYLIWDNLKDPVIRSHGASVWPYQVVSLEFVTFAAKFAAMAPPERSSPDVIQGFLTFRHSCQSCHRINGQGGEKSIELNYPMNVTEYYKPDFLVKWISNPQSVRYGTLMPPLSTETPDRDHVIKQIIAYLEAMKMKKIPPKEAGLR